MTLHHKARAHTRVLWVLLLGLAWSFLAPGVQAADWPARSGQLIVRFRQDLPPEAWAKAASQFGLQDPRPEIVRTALRQHHQLVLRRELTALGAEVVQTNGNTRSVQQALLSSPLVLSCEPNYLAHALTLPNDPYYVNGTGWWLQKVKADQAFDQGLAATGAQVVIAILDSGISLTHPDLTAKLVAGQNLVNPALAPDDDLGHGTHVAGIAGASTNNGSGIASVGYLDLIQLMPIKVLDAAGSGDYATIAEGITWAADHGARVLNMSFGGEPPSATLQSAVDYAYARGCVLVAAAGNDGDTTNVTNYPAACAHVIAVAATDENDQRASYSQYKDYVDLAAPGGSTTQMITSCVPLALFGQLYWGESGTSMAAPVVSGLAALLLAQGPSRTPDQVEFLMTSTADKVDTLARTGKSWDAFYGWGRVNVLRALTNQVTTSTANSSRPAYNYPNPFKPRQGEITEIVLPVIAGETWDPATLDIYDAAGNRVRSLTFSAARVAAKALLDWDGRNQAGQWVANGVYVFVLNYKGRSYSNKLAVLN